MQVAYEQPACGARAGKGARHSCASEEVSHTPPTARGGKRPGPARPPDQPPAGTMSSGDDMSDDDEYEYDSDDYSMSGDGDECKGGGDGQPMTLTQEALMPMYERANAAVTDLLGLTAEQAGLLLMTVDWNRDVTNTDWFDEGKAEKLRADAGLTTAVKLGTDPDPDLQFSCSVCLEDVDYGETYALSACKHRFCKDCWEEHIDASNKDSVFSTCIQEGCGIRVGHVSAKDCLGAEDYKRFMKWLLQRFVDSTHNKTVKWCPTAGCEMAVSNGNEAAFPEVNCSGCGERWCFGCRNEPHKPADCEAVRAWTEKSNDSDLSQMWIKANTKNCPKCGLTIVKDAGCQHMGCSRCKHQFCWLCSRPYSEHSEATGGFYACHKFEERIKAEGKTDAEKEALRAQRNLRNYNMAVERHLSHKQERESARTDLLELVNNHMEKLTKHGYSVGSFLTDAVATVVQCRRVLSWSYVYKFYKFDADDMDRELALFEDYQGRLEQLTRQLQDKIGSDVHEFLPPKRTSRRAGAGAAGAGAADAADRSKKFDVFREDVQRYGAALKRFLGSVLDFETAAKDFSGVEWVERAEVPSDKERHVWEWKDSHNVWNPFTDEIIATMEAALVEGKTQLDIRSGGRDYSVDLMAKLQTNKRTRGSRQIRRVKVKGGDWSCSECSYHNNASSRHCAMCERPRRR